MKYRDTKTIINGDTTIVYGEGEPNFELGLKINRTLDKIYFYSRKENLCWKDIIETRGVARCLPEDSYDEKKGIKIASRKAELKARQVQLKQYENIRNLLRKLSEDILNEEMSIAKRITIVKEEIKDE